MIRDIIDQVELFVGVMISLIGVMLVAIIGVATRHVYHEDGFSWRRMIRDIPFAVLCSIVAGATGEFLNAAPIIIYGISGSAGYLGPMFLAALLRRKAAQVVGAEDHGDADGH